jgi:hypothetical protein
LFLVHSRLFLCGGAPHNDVSREDELSYFVLGVVIVGLVWLVVKYGRSTGRGLPDAATRKDGSYAQLGAGDALGAGEEARANGARRHRHGSPQ